MSRVISHHVAIVFSSSWYLNLWSPRFRFSTVNRWSKPGNEFLWYNHNQSNFLAELRTVWTYFLTAPVYEFMIPFLLRNVFAAFNLWSYVQQKLKSNELSKIAKNTSGSWSAPFTAVHLFPAEKAQRCEHTFRLLIHWNLFLHLEKQNGR